MIHRELGLQFAIDTNRINSRQGSPAMNRLEDFAAKGLINIVMPQAAYNEAMRGANRQRHAKTALQIFTMDTFEGPHERDKRRKIEQVLYPAGARTEAERNDVSIVFHAAKYFCHLVTADGASKRQPGGILGHRDELAKLGVTVLTDVEAAALAIRKIRDRDEAALRLARVRGEAPPPWVGQDI